MLRNDNGQKTGKNTNHSISLRTVVRSSNKPPIKNLIKHNTQNNTPTQETEKTIAFSPPVF